MKRETIHVRVDDATIAAGDPWKVIHPVWWSVTIYDGPAEYERSLRPFSEQQRYVFAVLWYRAEVNNGGHRQFYGNSTGIVWKDALDAFREWNLPKFADILEQSANFLGGSPSFDRESRNDELKKMSPDFDELDERFYELEKEVDLEAEAMAIMRANPTAFHFDGQITRIVLPEKNKL